VGYGFIGLLCLGYLRASECTSLQLASQLELARYTNEQKFQLGSLVNCTKLSRAELRAS
jgi:hypothetical protein